MELANVVFENVSKEQQQIELPCNMTFNYVETEAGILVSVYGFTAGPPATINSPQILVPCYNPAACFDGFSIGGQYCAHMIAFLDTQVSTPIIKLRGWVTSFDQSSEGKFHEVSKEIQVKAKLISQ